MRQAHALYRAGRGIAVEHEFVPRCQHDFTYGKRTDAQFGALQVRQDRDRAAEFALHFPHDFITCLVVRMRTVTEIKTEHIGSGFKQGLYRFGTGTCGAECCDYFGVTLTSHIELPVDEMMRGAQ